RDLKKLIANNTFRQDLYYRLNVLPIKMPSLKDRKADILLLAENFYNAHCRQQKNTIPADIYLGRIAAQFLSYDWPGNIRELQNAIEYLVTISPDRPPSPSMLSEELQSTHTSLNAPKHQNLEPMILNTIAKFNEQKTPVGRRSLAAALSLPESEVRKSLSHLQREGLIQINKGRRGLTVLKDGANL
ncbi:MAG: sigma 54-interacting transcriptional regulator, partial [Phycisphaerales bacterium]